MNFASGLLATFMLLSSAHSKCTLPPALWCDNDAIARECHVEDACRRWQKTNEPYNVTILYETHCPHCQEYILNVVYPQLYQKSMLRLNQVRRINFVPWGNARRLADGRVVCQHGDDECSANRLSGCVLHHLDHNADAQINFVVCMEKHLKTGSTLHQTKRQCFEQARIDRELGRQIKMCFNGALGDHLERLAETITTNAWPDRHNGVPWILVNGKSLATVDAFMQNDIAFHIDNWHKQARLAHRHGINDFQPEYSQMIEPKHAARVFSATTHLEVIDPRNQQHPSYDTSNQNEQLQRQQAHNSTVNNIHQTQHYQRPYSNEQLEPVDAHQTVIDPNGLQVEVNDKRNSSTRQSISSEWGNQIYVKANVNEQ